MIRGINRIMSYPCLAIQSHRQRASPPPSVHKYTFVQDLCVCTGMWSVSCLRGHTAPSVDKPTPQTRDGQAYLDCHFQLALVQLLAVLTSSRSGDTSASAPTDACISGQEPGLSQIKRLDGRPVLDHNGGRGDGFWSRLDTCIPGQESGLSQKASRRPP